jgi:hypothetical protein
MTGVMGVGGTNANPAGPAKTGVFGYAPTDSASTGVLGEVSIGKAVRGNATGAGTGVVAESHGGTALLARQWGPAGVGVRIEHGGTGHALDVYGRIRWNLVARTTIGIGSNNKSVSIPWVTSSMMVVATMQSYVPGVYLAAAVPKAGSIVFQLNKSTTAAVTIAYYVVG